MGRYLLIGLLIFAIVITIIGRIRYFSPETQERLKAEKKAKEERFKNYTGRAEGRILEHHWEYYMDSAQAMKQHREDDMDISDDRFIVSYEFEVDGQTYTGKGEGSSDFRVRKHQTICYDPSDPNQNCTLCYLNSQTKQ